MGDGAPLSPRRPESSGSPALTPSTAARPGSNGRAGVRLQQRNWEDAMMIDRRKFLHLTGGLMASPAVLRATRANAAEVTLRLHHFVPAPGNPHQRLLLPWAKKVEDASGGRLKIDVYPSMQLGGTPPQLYDQARDGVVDMVLTLPGYTPGRFPKTEVMELPFVCARRSIVNSRAAQELADDHIQDQFKDVQLLYMWAHDHGVIHANKPIATMADLSGMKIRSPTRHAGEALKARGATAIGMPLPQIPESLAQKVIDGCVVPWEIVPAVKIQELVRNHTEIPGSPTLYTSVFIVVMNKARYAGLPADLRKVIDDHSGKAGAEMGGNVWDKAGEDVRDMVKARGNAIVSISEDESARWQKAVQPVIERWLVEMQAKGIDGGKLLETTRALLAKHAKA
jgi:TRAP-type C4-dicarboxylate transport system substrate-binding protein